MTSYSLAELKNMTVATLRDELEMEGLETKGRKAELIERYRACSTAIWFFVIRGYLGTLAPPLLLFLSVHWTSKARRTDLSRGTVHVVLYGWGEQGLKTILDRGPRNCSFVVLAPPLAKRMPAGV